MLSASGNKCSFRMYMREFAEKLIKSGHIHGYLAYSDGHVVGWCNAGDRSGYSYLGRHVDTKNMSDKSKVMAISCIEIAPKYRNMGVASELLKYVLKDSLNSGYKAVEAYPDAYEFISYDYYKYIV